VTEPSKRWVEVALSQFPHEAAGLRMIRDVLPEEAPFRAWSNFAFCDDEGMWHEVDLLVLGRSRLHLVELKNYSGVLRGNARIWRRDDHRAKDSPLMLAQLKAKRLRATLEKEFRWMDRDAAEATRVIPFVQVSVFLHHPDIRCQLESPYRRDLFGQDGLESTTGLDGISRRLLEPATGKEPVDVKREETIAELMARIGLQPRQRQAGSYIIDERPLDEGEGWQDWPAFNQVDTTKRVRIRFLVTPPGAPQTAHAELQQVAKHEFRITRRLANHHLLCPQDMVENDELGVGLVYPFDDRFQRLDLWLADKGGEASNADRMSILRQVAEAMAYAHGNGVVHRGLTPRAVLVRPLPDGGVKILVGDWQSGGTVPGMALTGVPSHGRTDQLRAAQDDSQEAFQAPEGTFSPDADRIRLDVFTLGALAYFVLSGHPAAFDRAAQLRRLHRDNGLDLTADWPNVPSPVQALVLESTRSAVRERLPDVRSFLERLAMAERALIRPAEDAPDPLEAPPGSIIERRFRLERRLGKGSTAVGLLVTDLTVANSGQGSIRVLKVAIDDAAARRLADEAEVLGALSNPRIVRLVEGPVEVGSRQALVLEIAGEETLGEVLHRTERLPSDRLERWGTDLLEAVVALERANVSHRDIKPANLGIRKATKGGAKHLVLFDFSLSRADTAAVTTGTPPYRDPFLDDPGRGRFDSAAERYSAAIVLFEMATGAAPQFGDGLSDPASIRDEAAVEARMFETAAPDALATFFRVALSRNARERHKNAGDMLTAWRTVFAPVIKTRPETNGERGTAQTPGMTAVQGRGAPPSTPRGPAIGVAAPVAVPEVDGGGGRRRDLWLVPGTGVPESSPEPVASAQERSRVRPRRVILALATALAVVGTAAGVVLAHSRGGSPASSPATQAAYAFAPHRYHDGLLIVRHWTLAGNNGSLLTETVTASSATGKPLRARFEEAIPTAIAPTLQTVRFTPAPAKTVQADPIVEWDLRLPAQGNVIVSYQAHVPPAGATHARLLRWAQALTAMEAKLAGGAHARLKNPTTRPTATPTSLPGPRNSSTTPGGRTSVPTPGKTHRPSPQPAAVPIPINQACAWAYPGQASGSWSGSGYSIVCLDANGQSLGGFPDGSGHSLNDWCADPSHTDGNPTLIQAKLTSSGGWICTIVQ
jgi:serine/threonine protein kinase